MAKHGTGGQVKVRLYMEGRHVPNGLTDVQVAGNTGQPSTAQLQVAPTNTIKHVLPGTWVHVFTTDPWDIEPAGDLSDFKLLFEGVVVSRGVTKQDDGRGVTLQCADPSVYWVEARQHWLNLMSTNGNIVDELVTATTSGHGRFTSVGTDGVKGYVLSEFGKILKDGEEHFLDTMLSSIDAIGNVNPFYTNIRNRFRLTDRILRGRAGQTEKLFTIAFMGDFMEGLAGQMSGQTNLAQVVNMLLSAIMHEWVSVVAPPYVPAVIFDRDVFGNIKRSSHTEHREDRKGRRTVTLHKYRMAHDNVVGSMIFKPHVYTLSPPSCNVLFPNMFDQVSFNQNFLTEPTRLQMTPQLAFARRKKLINTQMLRPTEMEIYTSVIRDPARRTQGQRTPDGKYADGEGQAPTFHEFDWTTNEERIRGIVPGFVNLGPAPGTLSLGPQGKKQPKGTRAGGAPQYLQNVASYEYYKAKFAARTTAIAGPYNMRPIPGFPLLALDDSAANMTIVAYLDSIIHSIDADGNAVTQYGLQYPRLIDEVDLNRPKPLAKPTADRGHLGLFRTAEGEYQFEQLFDGTNRPAIPEWFDDTFKELDQLNEKYNEWFGGDAGVAEKVLFTDSADDNNEISLSSAVSTLVSAYRDARAWGQEFIAASEYTDRAFTRIVDAFKFVGASPLEDADNAAKDLPDDAPVRRYEKTTAANRVTNYGTAKLDIFVGDTTAGSGYAGTSGSSVKGTAGATGDSLTSKTQARAVEDDASDRMSGAFPVFDTLVHTGDDATDQTARDNLLNDADQRKKSDWARFDGRPRVFDFEYRLWKESLNAASRSAVTLGNAALAAKYTTAAGGTVEAIDAATKAANTMAEANARTEAAVAEAEAARNGTPAPADTKNMTPEQQAPTGDEVEEGQALPLPEPLSEKQVVDLRRAIVDAYCDELARNRGFTG